MFSKDKNNGQDLFTNATFDTSSPDKIIIREKEAPKKKVRRRVKKGTKDQVLAAKAQKEPTEKVEKVPVAKADDKYKLPRLSDIEKKKDDYDYDFGSEFRATSADWKDKSIPDYSGLDDLSSDSFKDRFKNGITAVNVMQGIAIALLVLIFVSSLLTTNVYAKRECYMTRQAAMAQLVKYEDTSFSEVAEAVEDIEAPISMEEAAPKIIKTVTLVLSSVEKDLKIKLVDEDDILVKNVQWSVNVADADGNSTDAEDDDKDGIIHLTDVSAGDYSVTLNPSADLADFTVPTMAQTVSVKAKVEYKVIADIKEEIKSEKEINAAVEDNGNKAADVETSAKLQDTVEWLESTKTMTGEGYVEATPDISKTASIKKDNIFVALAEKIKATASSGFGLRTVGYPVLLAEPEHTHDVKYDSNGSGKHTSRCAVEGCTSFTAETTDCDTAGTDGACSKCGYKAQASHEHDVKYDSDGAGKHTSKCVAADCTGFTPETTDCDTTGADGACSKCGYKKSADAPHTLTYTQNSDGTTHNVTCSVSGCTTDPKTNVACVFDKENNTKCVCGRVKATTTGTVALSGTATVKVGDTTTITATLTPTGATIQAAAVDNSAVATAAISGNTVVVKGVKEGTTKLTVKGSGGGEASITITVTAAEQKYSDDAQLYDSNKNALYVNENGNYRLAKYKDYRTNPNQKFYRKQDEYKYTGWQTLDGKTYYYNRNNEAITGDHVIGGVKYHFGTDGALSQGSGTLGIDVSKYQPSINWASVKASGINYVIIRCGYRGSSTGVLVEDPYFKSHIKGAKAAGLKVGIYFFTTAVSEAEAVEEASMVAYLCKGYGIDYPVFMDCESSSRPGYNGMSASQRTAIIKAFCNTVRSAGYTPGVYANKTWLTSYMHAGELSGYKIWLAQYNAAGPTYAGRYDLWQYTSKGSVNGISGNVDMNQSYLGY